MKFKGGRTIQNNKNGDIVYEQLENAVQKTGVPCEILGDKGSDLHAVSGASRIEIVLL